MKKRTSRIPHSRPTFGAGEKRALARVLDSGFVTRGPEVRALENEFARAHDASYALATNSGVAALHLALEALGARDREVIVPSYVCAAVLNAIRLAGGREVVVDVEEHTFNIDPEKAKTAANRKTAAIVAPHMFGLPADISALKKIGPPVIEDCAMSLGARLATKGGKIEGHLAVFSFYGTKMIATGQGGMLVSNTKKYVDHAEDLSTYDNRSTWKLRYNYQMTDLAAALGREQLKQLGDFVLERRRIARAYNDAFRGLPIETPPALNADHVFFRYVPLAPGKTSSRIIESLAENKIESKPPVFKPLHRYLRLDRKKFPATERIFRSAVSLPIYPSLTESERLRVARAVRAVFR